MFPMKRFRVGVQPYKSRAERDHNGILYSTGEYYETIIEATDNFRAKQIAAAPHGGERNCEVRVFGEMR